MNILEQIQIPRKITNLFAWLFKSGATKKELKKVFDKDYTIFRDREYARKTLVKPFLDFCRINKEEFYTSTLGQIVLAFNGHISWSTLYKGKDANDIDVFFTDKKSYDEFIEFIGKSVGKDRFKYAVKNIERYKYLEDKSTVMYKYKRIDANLISHFQEIDEILELNPKVMDYFINSFKISESKTEEEEVLDENKFNPETKSFWVPVKKQKITWHDVYKIPKNIKAPYKNINNRWGRN